MINNEDLGKTFEKALCIYSGIDFDGNFKYSIEKATDISNDLKKRLPKDLFNIIKHTGKIDNSFDFIYENKNGLSVKTGKNKLIFLQKKNDKKINWKNFEYQFTKKTINLCHESNTLKVKFNDNFISIGEFQVHNNRNCIKFRFNFQKLLEIFKDYLEIKEY